MNLLKKIKRQNNKGYSIIEFLVVIFVIAVLTAVVVASYQPFKKNLLLSQSAEKMAEDIKRMEAMAIASQQWSKCPQGEVKGGYGVSFQNGGYILFADCNSDFNFNDNDKEKIEEVALNKDIVLNISYISASPSPSPSVSPSPSNTAICFVPPNPNVNFSPNSDSEAVQVTLSINGRIKNIFVNKAGLIYVK